MSYRNTLVLVALASAGLVTAAASYTSVNVTLQQQMGDLTLSPSTTSSPLLGARNPVIKNGVAYVSASHVSGDWALSLSPKMPLSVKLNHTSGDARLDLRTLKLTALDIEQKMGDLNLMLPSGNLMFSLKQTSGDTTIRLPANVGISVEVQKFTSGSITMGGKVVAEGMDVTGTFRSANYDAAKYKVQMIVSKEMGDLTLQ